MIVLGVLMMFYYRTGMCNFVVLPWGAGSANLRKNRKYVPKMVLLFGLGTSYSPAVFGVR
jgi:hypothetical protein